MAAILGTAGEHSRKEVEWDGLAVSPRYKFNPLPSSGWPQNLTPFF
jgi:hypothetical protein